MDERCDKISGVHPSCGLPTEPPLSEPLQALLTDASYVSASLPALSHSGSVGLAVQSWVCPPTQVLLAVVQRVFCLIEARPIPPRPPCTPTLCRVRYVTLPLARYLGPDLPGRGLCAYIFQPTKCLLKLTNSL